MTHSPLGRTFSREVIDAALPVVHPSLLPWLLKDRREAEEGHTREVTDEHGKKVHQHDRCGVDHARKELRRLKADLEAATTPNRRTILAIMVTQQEVAVQFWEGKMYLLDRVIENARKTQL